MMKGRLTEKQFDWIVERGFPKGKKFMRLPKDPKRRAMVEILLEENREKARKEKEESKDVRD